MRVVDIDQANTHLSRLIEKIAAGDSFIIANAGKPVARVMPVDTLYIGPRPVDFLQGAFRRPDDLDRMGTEEIGSLFGTEE